MSMNCGVVLVFFFSMVLGLVGLGIDWWVVMKLWGMLVWVGEVVMVVVMVVWGLLVVFYVLKWLCCGIEVCVEIEYFI